MEIQSVLASLIQIYPQMAFISFTMILSYDFIITSHGIATFIQLLPFNIYDFIHLISLYTNVHVV